MCFYFLLFLSCPKGQSEGSMANESSQDLVDYLTMLETWKYEIFKRFFHTNVTNNLHINWLTCV